MSVLTFLKKTCLSSKILFFIWLFLGIISNFSETSKLMTFVAYALVLLCPAVLNELRKHPVFFHFWKRKAKSLFWKFLYYVKPISVILFWLWLSTSIACTVELAGVISFFIMGIIYLIPVCLIETITNPIAKILRHKKPTPKPPLHHTIGGIFLIIFGTSLSAFFLLPSLGFLLDEEFKTAMGVPGFILMLIFGTIGLIILITGIQYINGERFAKVLAKKEAQHNSTVSRSYISDDHAIAEDIENENVSNHSTTTPTIMTIEKNVVKHDPTDISNVDGMEGHAFEYFCAELLQHNGFANVTVTRGSGDQGVDIIATKEGIKYAIQCKNYASPLSNKPIQEVHAGKAFYNCHVGVVMTNSRFTPGAIQLADATGVLLWDRDHVQKLMRN